MRMMKVNGSGSAPDNLWLILSGFKVCLSEIFPFYKYSSGEPDSGTIANCMQYTASYDSASDQFCMNRNFPLCQMVRNQTKSNNQ